MMLKKWDDLPEEFHNDKVRAYYDILEKKKLSLLGKRIFDLITACILLIFLIIPMLVIAIMIKCTSKGHVIFKQERVTKYGRIFNIYKFRTMYTDKMEKGYQITVKDDPRITPVGKKLRKLRLDELPQIFNVLGGSMSFVGTRPEVMKYVKHYSPEMYASLLMPAGITSVTCIIYKDEDELLKNPEQIEYDYLNGIMQKKMRTNLMYIRKFCVLYDIAVMIRTVKEVFSPRGKSRK